MPDNDLSILQLTEHPEGAGQEGGHPGMVGSQGGETPTLEQRRQRAHELMEAERALEEEEATRRSRSWQHAQEMTARLGESRRRQTEHRRQLAAAAAEERAREHQRQLTAATEAERARQEELLREREHRRQVERAARMERAAEIASIVYPPETLHRLELQRQEREIQRVLEERAQFRAATLDSILADLDVHRARLQSRLQDIQGGFETQALEEERNMREGGRMQQQQQTPLQRSSVPIGECPVCFNDLEEGDDVVRGGEHTQCEHLMHRGCRQQWYDTPVVIWGDEHRPRLEHERTCPMCRALQRRTKPHARAGKKKRMRK